MRSKRPDFRLSQLIETESIVEESIDRDVVINSLCTDSRRATPGCLFIAMPGLRTDGADHIEEAVTRGAVAVLSEKDHWVPRQAKLVRVLNVRRALAVAAQRFHDHPQLKMRLIGVTGTSGKTVVTSLLHELISPDQKCGLLGTIHYHLGSRTLPSYRTTPEPVDLYSMLGQMRDNDCENCVIEVSSHGIDQGRVADLDFSSIALLNLGEQHLDYHGSMAEYLDTTLRIFDGRNGSLPKTAVINADDALSQELVAKIPVEVDVVKIGQSEGCDLRASSAECDSEGIRFSLQWADEVFEIRAPLVGRFNVTNILAALALGAAAGVEREVLVRRLKTVGQIRGRMETISGGQSFPVVVDYMHTPESYLSGLATLRELTKGRLIVVYGCGGDRDRTIRSKISRSVKKLSDLAFATADNPRSEDLSQIFEDMQLGAPASDTMQYIENRRLAIGMAIEEARKGDIVLVAGKGHESYQEFADSVTPFDDRSVVREIIRRSQKGEASKA
tara:strand:+ start:56341 stop:57846 length:1506 start_codon:yes stop_codon:yes gene_type:complete